VCSSDLLSNYWELNPFASIGRYTGANANVQLDPLTHEGDTVYAVWTIRIFSLLLGVVTLLCVYHVAKLVWDERLGLGAMLFTASIPMFVHVSATVNNDNLNITLSALTIAVLVQMWHNRNITRVQSVALGMLTVGILITKLTGIIVYGYTIGALLLGGIIGRFKWQQVIIALAAIGAAFLIFGLWWFVRSYVLYGDPIGLSPTLDLWSRNRDRLPDSHEVRGIWVSFWMMFGHLNIPGPVWLVPYAYIVTALAAVGVIVRAVRDVETRWYVLFMLAVQAMAWAVVVYITRQVNVSQGRALFMALATFSPLMVVGWRALLGKHAFILPVIPLIIATVTVPFTAIATAYESLAVLPNNNIPADIRRIDARAESITVHGYKLLTNTAAPDEEIALDVYFSGGDPENPIVFVTAQHPLTGERLGVIDTYPGMVATRDLRDDQTYRARLRFLLADAPENTQPFQIQLALGWRTVDARDEGQGRYLQWFDAQENTLGGVFLAGPVYKDPAYTPPQMATDFNANFGELIGLRGYTLMQEDDTVSVELLWERLATINTNYTLTVGLLDEENNLIAQQDAPPPGYPTSTWVESEPFTTAHTLQIPADNTDTLRLRVGWYASETFDVLATDTAETLDGMLVLPLEQ